MPWEINYLSDLNIIETLFIGNLNKVELQNAIEETLLKSAQHSTYKFLADCLNLTGGHSIFDLYEFADFSKSEIVIHLMKEAVILPINKNSVEKVKFWETTCLNRGLNVRIFNTREEALKWLNS